jgi:membrane fusion protein, multidrug efflux system
MKRIRLFPVLLSILLLAGAGCHSTGDEAAKPDLEALKVEMAVVAEKPMPRILALTGSLVANQQANVAANALGVVTRTFVERGTLVKEGDSLAQLDIAAATLSQAEAQANLESVRAQQRFSDKQCQRYEALVKDNHISPSEWDRVRSDCRRMDETAKAASVRVELMEKLLHDTTVRAPFSGLVDERFVSVGEYVQPPSRVVSLVQITPLRLQLSVPEDQIGSVAKDGEVSFEVAAFPGEIFTGTVAYIAAAVRQTTRDLVFEATVPNPDGRLRPGMFAAASLKLPDETLPAVPRKSLRPEGGVSYLMMVVDGYVQARVVQVGTQRDGEVALIDGVKAGERYVLTPSDQVKDGTAVR